MLEDAFPLGLFEGGWAGGDVFPAEKGVEIDIAGLEREERLCSTF